MSINLSNQSRSLLGCQYVNLGSRFQPSSWILTNLQDILCPISWMWFKEIKIPYPILLSKVNSTEKKLSQKVIYPESIYESLLHTDVHANKVTISFATSLWK